MAKNSSRSLTSIGRPSRRPRWRECSGLVALRSLTEDTRGASPEAGADEAADILPAPLGEKVLGLGSIELVARRHPTSAVGKTLPEGVADSTLSSGVATSLLICGATTWLLIGGAATTLLSSTPDPLLFAGALDAPPLVPFANDTISAITSKLFTRLLPSMSATAARSAAVNLWAAA